MKTLGLNENLLTRFVRNATVTQGTVLCVHEQAKRIIEMSSGCSNASEFQQLSEFDKEEYLNEFKNKGLSILQVSRLTGVSFGLVRKFY